MRSRIYTIISGHFKSWYRSKSNIFWTIAFPLLLIVLFGAIFGNGSTKFDLYLQNQDLNANVPTFYSQGYITVLNNTGAFNLHVVAAEQPDPLTYVKNDAQLHNRGQRLLVIPLGFNQTLKNGGNATVQLYMDQSDQASASLAGIVRSVTISYAASIAGSPNHLFLQQVGIVTRNIRYIDFFIPGVIGMTLLTTGVFGAVNTNGRYRELKIIKKLATTPLSKIEWILGMVGYQMILATISLVVILFFGYAIFGVTATIDIYTVGLVVARGCRGQRDNLSHDVLGWNLLAPRDTSGHHEDHSELHATNVRERWTKGCADLRGTSPSPDKHDHSVGPSSLLYRSR